MAEKSNFIRQIIDDDLSNGKHQTIQTRFPPEPNGYLHIGHAKSIVLNFGIAGNYAGRCNLRFDDTNPQKENLEYVNAIKNDIAWLGYQWDALYFASDYFEQLYQYAIELIEKGLAFVCELNAEQMRSFRGTLTEPGKNSPWRERSVKENLDLFKRMKAGEFEDGSKVLRAKIDMASPNINMRDPVLYRIRSGLIHHQTGDRWCLYPMYDFTHPISDALEGITHSLCTLEFEDHRPLYDWVLDHISIKCHPRQIEFSRLNLQYTVMSKRKLTQLVDEHHVSGWDDPRLPTLVGLKRRGYSPQAIRLFCDRIGISKADNSIEMAMLEACIREELEGSALRRMAVLEPLKIVITNFPDQEQRLELANHPKDERMGKRVVFMTREIYIEKDDFRETANKKYKRLVLGERVRLRGSYVIRCDEAIKNDEGEIIQLNCSYDEKTLGKNPQEGKKPRGVIHWVSAESGKAAEFRLYDRLFNHPQPDTDKEVEDWKMHINPESLMIKQGYIEPALASASDPGRVQFERIGYFYPDLESSADKPIFNRIVTLRDRWVKSESTSKS